MNEKLGPIGIIVSGLDTIAEGRMFFAGEVAFDENGEVRLPWLGDAPKLSRLTITKQGCQITDLVPVSDDTPLCCPECGQVLKRDLFLHTEAWMFSVLFCRNHPFKVLLDIFPKTGEDTAKDWMNAFAGFDVPDPRAYPDYLNAKRRIAPLFLLTPDGLSKIPIDPD